MQKTKQFKAHNKVLNPKFWSGNNIDSVHCSTLDPKIALRLKNIALFFWKDVELKLPIYDVLFLGSNANYNWNAESDIDLHVVVDTSKISKDPEIVQNFIKALKNKWNNDHDIKVKGHKVELYIHDIKEKSRSTSIYSVLRNCWIRMPVHNPKVVNKNKLFKDYNKMVKQINKSIKSKNIEELKKLIKYLYDYRDNGLDSEHGELSTQNLIFKLLRNKGVIDKLRKSIIDLKDKELSLKESNTILNELGNSPYPYNKEHDTDKYESFKFKTDSSNEIYKVVLYNDDIAFLTHNIFRKMPDILEPGHSKLTGKERSTEIVFSKLDAKGNDIHNMSSTKDFIKVLSTVSTIIKNEVPKDNIIMFAAKESTRVKLYSRYVKTFENNYQVVVAPSEDTRSGDVIYLLIPKSKL